LSVRSSHLAMAILSGGVELLLDDFALTGTSLLYCDADAIFGRSRRVTEAKTAVILGQDRHSGLASIARARE
jgi:hypothetical protein